MSPVDASPAQEDEEPGSGLEQHGLEHLRDGDPGDLSGTGARRARRLPLYAVAVLLVAAFVAGYAVRDFVLPRLGVVPSGIANPIQVGARVEEVAGILAREAYDPPTLDEATEAAVDGLVDASGDAHAEYYTPEEYQRYLDGGQGSYAGIGIVLDEKDGAVVVQHVYPDSPADNAGVRAGDVIIAVNGDRRDEWIVQDVSDAIGDEVGSDVELVVNRADADDEGSGSAGGKTGELTFTMTVGTVDVPDLDYKMWDGHIGYILLARFTRKAPGEVGEALRELEDQGAAGYVIDLRFNPGGYVAQCKEIVSMFIDEGAVLQIQQRGSTKSEYVSGDMICDKPVIVLVNGGSASASEIFAAAMQDHGRAKVVGERTYGKGTVQTARDVSFGGGIKYTIAHYLSADGHEIDGVGVTPDIIVKPDGGEEDTQLERALEECRKLVEDEA